MVKEKVGEIYVEKLARTSRDMLVASKVITENIMEYADGVLQQIVAFFGGKLTIGEPNTVYRGNDKNCDYIEKLDDNNAFLIFVQRENVRALCMRVFHELGHAFIDVPNMSKGERCYFDGNKASDIQAELFARAFLMPAPEFESVAKRCIVDGRFNVEQIAQMYHIDYVDVLVRGKELNYWE